MEKGLVQNLQSALPSIFPIIKGGDKVVINYDKDGDVLYVSFGQPKSADDTEIIGSNLLIRKKGKKIIGITFLNFKSSPFLR